MRFSYIQNTSVIRQPDLTQRSDLSEVVRSHFQHQHFRIYRSIEQSKWYSDMVIEIPLSGKHPVFPLQHKMQQVLIGGFPVAAGDGQHDRTDFLSIFPRRFLHQSEDILCHKTAVIQLKFRIGNDDGSRTLLQCLVYKTMPVRFLPGQSKKYISLLQYPRINTRAGTFTDHSPQFFRNIHNCCIIRREKR